MPTRRQLRAGSEERSNFSDLVQWMKAGNVTFPTGLNYSWAGGTGESIGESYIDYVQQIYKRNGIVFACMKVRQDVFSEVRFRFANLTDGKLGTLFGTSALGLLEKPWPNGTTGELATRMIQDADLAGNFYAVADAGRIWRRRPDRIVLALDGNPLQDEYVSVAGYLYYPSGIKEGGGHFTYLPDEMCHWSPLPDPEAEYRGMSWITPVMREVRADGAATDHKLEFFDNAGTPQMVVKTPADVMTKEQFDDFLERMNRAHTGRGNRHKTLYLVPGADVEVVGKDFQQLDFGNTQGRDETRIAAAAGVPAVIVGLKESLQGSSLNSGNYGSARRRFADATMRPLYRSAAAALDAIVPAPQAKGPAQLWYDDSQVAFFREDRQDAAEIQFKKSQTIRNLTDAGFEPVSVIAAVEAEDPTLLKHSGLYSVQLQKPGSGQPAASPAA